MKKIKFVSFLVFSLILFFEIATAQTISDVEDQILSSINKRAETFNNSIITNQAFIDQVGIENSANINQTLTNALNGNIGLINQSGDFNTAILNEFGSGLNGSISQNGNYNYAKVNLTGNDISIDIDQNGNNNYVNQEIVGQGLEYDVLQQGSYNELIQVENNGESVGYSISQVGVGITTIIVNGNVYLP